MDSSEFDATDAISGGKAPIRDPLRKERQSDPIQKRAGNKTGHDANEVMHSTLINFECFAFLKLIGILFQVLVCLFFLFN